MSDLPSPTYLRLLASSYLIAATDGRTVQVPPMNALELSSLLAMLADRIEGGMSLVEFAKTGEPRPCAEVVPFTPRRRIPINTLNGAA